MNRRAPPPELAHQVRHNRRNAIEGAQPAKLQLRNAQLRPRAHLIDQHELHPRPRLRIPDPGEGGSDPGQAGRVAVGVPALPVEGADRVLGLLPEDRLPVDFFDELGGQQVPVGEG